MAGQDSEESGVDWAVCVAVQSLAVSSPWEERFQQCLELLRHKDDKHK